MKLYNSMGPNPHAVRMFLAEKGMEVPIEEVDLMGAENRQAPYLKVNSMGQIPALVLDDGTVVSEITAICEYFDEIGAGPKIIGETPEERAQTRRWTRWVDLNICEPMANGFRFSEGLQLFENRMRCLPEAAAGLKACAQDKMAWLDGQLATRDYVAGDKFSLADILLFCFQNFGNSIGQPINPEFTHVTAWFNRIKERASAAA